MQRTPGTSSSDDSTAREAAAEAAAMASNARQMILNRDPAMADLQAAAMSTQQKIDALMAAPTAAALTIATGQAKTSSLLALGGSTDLTLTLTRTMPSATYNVEIIPISSGLLPGAATITVKAQTRTTVTLTVAASLAVAASSIVSVIAWG